VKQDEQPLVKVAYQGNRYEEDSRHNNAGDIVGVAGSDECPLYENQRGETAHNDLEPSTSYNLHFSWIGHTAS
jgi:hypothetical protein